MLLFLLVCFAFSKVSAQRELLSEDRTSQNDTTPTYGKNERNYFHYRMGLGFIVGPADKGLLMGYGRSLEAYTGFRYKRKLSNMFAIGLEPSYKYTGINISQKDKNTFLDTTFWGSGKDTAHNREKLGFHSASLGAFLRINFDPHRGNYMGYYLDLGAGGDYIFANNYVVNGERTNGTFVKTRFTRNPFVSHFQYNYFARLGFNWLALTFTYRPSNLFKTEYNFPEPPKYVAGLELNLYGK